MKKFLSVLLALAVAFTFTFGSTMSAFAAPSTDYEKSVLEYAYSQVAPGTIEVDYDGKYTTQKDQNGNTLDDITSFVVKEEYVKKAVDKAYDEALTDFSKLGVAPKNDFEVGKEDSSIDALNVKNALVKAAKDTYRAVAYEAAFNDYKEMLKGFVNSVDLTKYTDTKQDAAYVAKDGEKYYTSVEAATADRDWALAVIDHCSYGSKSTPSSTTEWKGGFGDLYKAVFGSVITITENKDNPYAESVVTSLTYSVRDVDNEKKPYATKKSEEADNANKEVTKAAAKANLIAAITTYENNNTLKADAQAQLDAYKEAKLYLIENAKTFTKTYAIIDVTKDGVKVTEDGTDYKDKFYDYVAIAKTAKKAKDEFAQAKVDAATQGWYYDQTVADKKLVEALVKVYTEQKYSVYYGENALTASKKAEAKAGYDYSKVKAVTDKTYGIDTFTFKDKTYFAKEWEEVKAAVDAYVAAIDAAETVDDINDAKDACKAKIDKIDVTTKAAASIASYSTSRIAQYFNLKKATYNAGKTSTEEIYVIWNDNGYVTNVTDNDNNVRGWMLDKGARTAKEADALYDEACKVIDAFKTMADLKAEAEAVKAAIAALPATVTLADKDAIIDANDALKALDPSVTKYVTNKTTLNNAIKAVENLEADAVRALFAKLPKVADVTVADKEAVKAAIDAYKAYDETEAYTTKHYKNTEIEAYESAVKAAEKAAIEKAYKALKLKYDNNKLTEDDVAAVKALQDALDAYIDEYAEGITGVSESVIANIANAVAALAPAYDDQDAKADLLEMDRKITIWRTSKNSIRVTVKGSVQNITDNGYTVKYRFYKKNPGAKKYTLIKTTSATKYTYTNLKKGGNRFQVKVSVYDKDGNFVASKMTYYRYAKIK